MRARRTVLLLLILPLFAVPAPAFAHDHVVPEPTLHAAGQTQQAGFVEVQWIWQTGPNTCVQLNAIGDGRFPDPPIVAPAGTRRAYIDLDTATAPEHIEMYSWRKLDQRGAPAGETRAHPVTLDGSKGTVRAYFTPPKRGNAYLQMFALWPDQEGCGGEQWGIWRFSLRVEAP
jgi:hypothetical protein